jgi:hypothetical protein
MKCERALVGEFDWAVAIAAKKRLSVSFFMSLFPPGMFEGGAPARPW